MRKGPYLRPIFAVPVDVLVTFEILRVSIPEFLLARYCISDDGTTLNPFCLYILISVFSYTFCIFTECHPFKCRWQVRVTTLPADVLASSGARPSACTVLTIKLDMLTSTFFYLWRLLHIYLWTGAIHSGQRVITKHRSNSNATAVFHVRLGRSLDLHVLDRHQQIWTRIAYISFSTQIWRRYLKFLVKNGLVCHTLNIVVAL